MVLDIQYQHGKPCWYWTTTWLSIANFLILEQFCIECHQTLPFCYAKVQQHQINYYPCSVYQAVFFFTHLSCYLLHWTFSVQPLTSFRIDSKLILRPLSIIQVTPLGGKSYRRPISVTQIRADLRRQQSSTTAKSYHPESCLDWVSLSTAFCAVALLEFVLQRLGNGSSFPPKNVTWYKW